MAAQIRDARRDHRRTDVVVVTGGFHSPAHPRACSPAATQVRWPRERTHRANRRWPRGIALTPYSYARLDSLTGYDGRHAEPWLLRPVCGRRATRAGAAPSPPGWRCTQIVARLRSSDQPVSAADLIALDVDRPGASPLCAAIARCGGATWSIAILGALVKDELDVGVAHPMLEACHEVLRGAAVGRSGRWRAPPAVRDRTWRTGCARSTSSPSRGRGT